MIKQKSKDNQVIQIQNKKTLLHYIPYTKINNDFDNYIKILKYKSNNNNSNIDSLSQSLPKSYRHKIYLIKRPKMTPKLKQFLISKIEMSSLSNNDTPSKKDKLNKDKKNFTSELEKYFTKSKLFSRNKKQILRLRSQSMSSLLSTKNYQYKKTENKKKKKVKFDDNFVSIINIESYKYLNKAKSQENNFEPFNKNKNDIDIAKLKCQCNII